MELVSYGDPAGHRARTSGTAPVQVTTTYKFRSNSDLCLTGDLREVLPGVIAYGIQFDLNLYTGTNPGRLVTLII